VTGLLIAACGTTRPTSSASTSAGSVAASAASATASPGTPSASPSLAAVQADPSLLDVLTASPAKLNVTYDPDTTASVMADPSVAGDLSALAIGLATPAAQASPQEFVIANVARLRDPTKSDAWFRSWRDTYDQAACEQAGGVQGNAETQMSGQTVYIGSCRNGALTYHVRLEDGSIVISMTSIGPSRLGERLVRATLASSAP